MIAKSPLKRCFLFLCVNRLPLKAVLACTIGASSALLVHLLPWPRSRASTFAWESLCKAEKLAAEAVYDLARAYSLWPRTTVAVTAASEGNDGVINETAHARARAELLSRAEECVFNAEQACETLRKRKREMAWERLWACTPSMKARGEMEDARVRDAARLTLLAGGLYLGLVACKSHASRRGRDVLPDVHILREHAQLVCDGTRREHQHLETEKQQLCWLVRLVDECRRQEDFLDFHLSPSFVNIAKLVQKSSKVYSVVARGNKRIKQRQVRFRKLSRMFHLLDSVHTCKQQTCPVNTCMPCPALPVLIHHSCATDYFPQLQ